MATTTEPTIDGTTGNAADVAPIDTANQTPDRTRTDLLTLPRWIVYCQAAMLGVVATTFFVLGLMVGNLTSGSGVAGGRIETSVSGLITFEQGGVEFPDSDAVVMILPADQRPAERSKAETVNPLSFVPLNNSGIDGVYALGGAIVRANEEGRFRVIVEGPQHFHVLVISRHATRNDGDGLTKPQRAAVANFFIPVESAVGDQRVFWSTFEADYDSYQLPDVKFK